ncbi:hypothetical protein SK128_001480 [Halocaridina rubra]|uniref:UDP-glucuronosyltransferase n=1 Tax=Halocaridina rubra TaxID=373956 RepID=A0AAN9A3F9_HALRR
MDARMMCFWRFIVLTSAFYLLTISSVSTASSDGDKSSECTQTTGECYNILMLLPLSSRSHRSLFTTLAEALAIRGHKIELLVNHAPRNLHPNIREIYHGLHHFREDRYQLFEARASPWKMYELLIKGLPQMTREIYRVPEVMELYKRRKDFHLVIIDNFFNMMMFPFAHEIPLVMMQASGVDIVQSAITGNVINPAYTPSNQLIVPQPMSLWHRILNGIVYITYGLLKQHYFLPRIQAEITQILPDIPPLREIERNQSLALLNYCYSFDTVLPLLPSQIDIGAIHCRPGQPLPQDLEDWINGAGEAGVIYFSLGTVALGTTLPPALRELFINAFGRLKQRVLWKLEEELHIADNILVRKWLPQQDILAHPRVKLFISHGGMLSTQEAVFHAVPVLALPILGDQPRNAQNIDINKLGIALIWEELTEDLLVDTIEKIINTKMYEENMEVASRALRDQPQTPKERAVFWTEYIIRHQGAPHLRSPGAKLSWLEYLMIDVIFILTVIIICFTFIWCWILRCAFRKLRTSKDKILKRD